MNRDIRDISDQRVGRDENKGTYVAYIALVAVRDGER
jgi:hypothetical protein